MAASSIPAATDYLVTTVKALPVCADPVVVSDGYSPVEANGSVVLIGVTEQTGEIATRLVFGALGPKSSSEVFDIPCAIYSHTGNSDTASVKLVRDAAFAIFNAIITFVLADPSLGGTLGPTAGAGVASISSEAVHQTFTDAEAEAGRMARIYFTVHCTAYFPPTA